jgi:tRNA A37 methylthiotransferase MiaB
MYVGFDTIEIKVPCLRISSIIELQELQNYLSRYDEDYEYYEFVDDLLTSIKECIELLNNCRTSEISEIHETQDFNLTIHGYDNISTLIYILIDLERHVKNTKFFDKCYKTKDEFKKLEKTLLSKIKNTIKINKGCNNAE